MTNSELLHKTEDYQGSLSYDTTFFHGTSGSPVFEMNGYIIAMHTQAYTLERTHDDVASGECSIRRMFQIQSTKMFRILSTKMSRIQRTMMYRIQSTQTFRIQRTTMSRINTKMFRIQCKEMKLSEGFFHITH